MDGGRQSVGLTALQHNITSVIVAFAKCLNTYPHVEKSSEKDFGVSIKPAVSVFRRPSTSVSARLIYISL
ncbi:hypothetical protein MCC93_11150 [Morococcus cerebrosus]|uniref:Uncharacterized protein n=1 Tax=Morococcus cerebrosus TaxID=1056807 RepID=A0A0C1E9D7_9NEIS|nr:hypothetical protein MCC93_11150 [Morococcus cerebrosus]